MEIIRKIIIGRDPKNALAYVLGMKAGSGVVSGIMHDDRALHTYGINRYVIYIFQEGEGNIMWKTIDNMPVIVEYDCNFD